MSLYGGSFYDSGDPSFLALYSKELLRTIIHSFVGVIRHILRSTRECVYLYIILSLDIRNREIILRESKRLSHLSFYKLLDGHKVFEVLVVRADFKVLDTS